MFTFTIDENNAISGFAETQTEPCLFQPHKPDGTEWANKAEAEAWATAWIAHMTDPENNAFPA